MTKHMFAGASTPVGFVDLFDHIMPVEKAKKRLFLKGSSGSGKSTFMKTTAAEFESMGIHAEKFHCANDTKSLDAVAFSDIGLCIIDATAPHAHDPEIPMAIDRIIDFAQFIDENKLLPHLDELKSLQIAKKLSSKNVSHYLRALGNIYSAENDVCEAVLSKRAVTELAQKWLDSLDAENLSERPGIERKLFLSAITPDGYRSFTDDYFKNCKVYGASCEATAGINLFLTELKNHAIARGLCVTSFYCPFAPGQIEHLYFPQTDEAFARVSGRFGYESKVDEVIDVSECAGIDIKHSGKLDIFDKLLSDSVDLMYTGRTLHNRTEEIYASAMNFASLNRAAKGIIKELLLLPPL